MLQLLKLPDGTVKVLVEGKRRAADRRASPTAASYYEAEAAIVTEEGGDAHEAEALSRAVIEQFENYVKLNKKVPPEALASIPQITEPGALADTIAAHLAVKIADKQQLLEIFNVVKRLEKVFALMEGEISVLQVEKKIRSRVKRQMEKTQREYYLNEQMKAIQRELGEQDDARDELIELEKRIKKTKLSKEARTKAEGELKKLRNMSPMSAEMHGGAQLPRLAAVDPVGQGQDQADRPGEGRGDPRGRPLRPGEGQGADPRVPGRAGPHRLAEGADPVPRRPARASARPRSAARSPRRRAASSCACRWAACATRPRSAATGAPTSARCPARSSSR